MGNCNTLTCQIDGKIHPMHTDGKPFDDDDRANADRCGERGRRGERRGHANPDPLTPPLAATMIRMNDPGLHPSMPQVQGGRDVKLMPPIVPLRRASNGGDGGMARASGGGSTPSASTGSDVAPTDAAKAAEVARSRAAYAEQQAAQSEAAARATIAAKGTDVPLAPGQKPAGALASADDCYRAFMGLPPDKQAAILTAGILGRYGMCHAVARDVLSFAPGAARAGADWLFTSFPRNSPEIAQFCSGVQFIAPASGYYAAPAGAPSAYNLVANGNSDRWTPAFKAGRAEFMQRHFNAAGEIALIDYPAAQQLFAVLPTAAQIDVLSGSAFERDPYAPVLAHALEIGQAAIDGVSIADLLAGHMAQFTVDDPRLVLFRLAVQDAQRNPAVMAPAGMIFRTRSAGDVTPPRTAATAATPAATPPTAAPSEFLAAMGITPAQWSSMLAAHPDTAAQLFREFQTRPSTFQQVSQAALTAIGVIITGVHQGRVDDLAATSAAYQHQEAMANIAYQREQAAQAAEISRINAASAQQQPAPAPAPAPVMMQQYPLTQPAPQQQQQGSASSGLSTATMAYIALAVAAVGGGAYFFMRRKKPNAHHARSRKRNRRARRHARGSR